MAKLELNVLKIRRCFLKYKELSQNLTCQTRFRLSRRRELYTKMLCLNDTTDHLKSVQDEYNKTTHLTEQKMEQMKKSNEVL